MKTIIWGAGGTTKEFLIRPIMNYKYDIICIVDNDSSKWGTVFNGYKVISPSDIEKYEYDIIIICSIYSNVIYSQLTKKLGVKSNKITTYFDIDKDICKKLVDKYNISDEEDVKLTLKEFEKGKTSILGAYNPPFKVFHEVRRDEFGWPYIMFDDKRMYYPINYNFTMMDGREVVPDIRYEQGKGSPHLYIPADYSMPDDAVIVDAGTCEGNFALRFIENAKRIYLIEADKCWMEALERTFSPYSNKVVFVNKFLSGRDNANEITVDSLISEKIDFLKMDIEGSEIDAILGAKRVLTTYDVKCAICSYHRQYDEKYIEHIMNSYGYETSTSEGYIFFAYDKDMKDTLDLRRGVVYATKR